MKAPDKIYVEVCEDGIFAFPKPPFEESVEYIRSDLVGQSLQQEQPVEGLEEAADKYSFKYSDFDTEDGGYNVYDHEKREAFKAGAEWQKKQDDLETADLLAIAHLQGMEQQKSKMMEEAVEKYVHELYTDEEGYHCYISLGTEYAPGDKVRVIVINED